MKIDEIIKELEKYKTSERRGSTLLTAFCLIGYLALLFLFLKYYNLIVALVVTCAVLSASIFFLFKKGCFASYGLLNAAELLDEKLKTKERFVSYLKAQNENELSVVQLLKEQLEKNVPDGINFSDYKEKKRKPIAWIVLFIIYAALYLFYPAMFGMSYVPKTEKAKEIMELVKEEELPKEVERKLEALAEAIDEYGLNSEEAEDALSEAEAEIENAKQELKEEVKEQEEQEKQEQQQKEQEKQQQKKQEKQQDDAQKPEEQNSEQEKQQEKSQQAQSGNDEGQQQGEQSKDKQGGTQDKKDDEGGDKSSESGGAKGDDSSDDNKQQSDKAGKDSEGEGKESGKNGGEKDSESGEQGENDSGDKQAQTGKETESKDNQDGENKDGNKEEQSLRKAESALNKLKEEQKNEQQSAGQDQSQQNEQNSKTSNPADQGEKGDEGDSGDENGGKPQAEGDKGKQDQSLKPAGDNHKEDPRKQKGEGNSGAGASEFSLNKDAEKKLLDDDAELSKHDTFEEQHIKASEEKYDLTKVGELTGLAKSTKESSYKTQLGDIKLEKPETIKGKEDQQIPLEYQDLVK